ncbi:hypothetical protein [Pontiella sulfatireligans]|uniref:Beta-galactosidase trimerisation domain-containing protein n=1 Tax=Pontiella sulfatireligans TaxID=2750658 RepID=A0A6C2URH5_9BACT|nr:hypothetical protein [Pontiella sulfatireligans]VGO22905.1 hypothetical protein SCARR_05002 [Pontiella sulfatireligans]
MNTSNPFKIILRYGLDPFNGLEENLKQLEIFIKESTINEVMFLLMPEERSSGHPTKEISQPWCDAIKKAQAMFAKYGVETSLNPWTTTYHAGRGRHLHADQDFRLMVGETGADNGMSPCPLCKNWQAYLIDYFVYLTKEIQPVALWVEDDWRLHNHGGEMGYGGCFCECCLERFAEMVGETSVTREQVVAKVAAPGEPHPWRAQWLELAWQALSEPAQKLTDALKAEKPEMRIGLMSSIPDVQSIEKRDWNGLMNIFTDDGENYLIRPHMPPYTEEPPITTAPCYSRQTIALLDRDADIYPELENSPRCGPYSGTHKYSIWEMTNGILYGARGITINHFDNMGMNTYADRGFGKVLGKKRKQFDTLMGLKLDDRKARGVKVLFSPDIAQHKWAGASGGGAKMYTGEDLSKFETGGGSLNDLQANSTEWSKVFYILGISHSFTRDIHGEKGDIFAVSDQTLRCYSDDEIKILLSQNIILDLPSSEVLVQRGFGSLIGVKNISRTKLEESAYSMEEVEEAFFGKMEGDVKPRMCAQRVATPIGVLNYAEGTETLSTIKGAEFDAKFPGSGMYRNELGGTVYTTCYPLGNAQFYMAYFNRVRQEYWSKVLFNMSKGNGSQTIATGHPFHVHAHDLEGGISIACTNVIYDTSENVSLQVNAHEIEGKKFQTLENAAWVNIDPQIEIEGHVATLSFDLQVRTLETALIVMR